MKSVLLGLRAARLRCRILAGPTAATSVITLAVLGWASPAGAGSWSKSQRWMMDVLRPNVPWRSRRGGDVPLVHDER
jgi:hypothetical protein